MQRMHLRIEGRVQGVAFRASARSKARELGLSGWVRNEPDGSVTLEAEGEESQLHELRRWCEKGPPMARVERVHDRYAEAGGDLPQPFGVDR